MRQTFQQEETEQILQEAVRREVQQAPMGSVTPAVSRERLLAMAGELGITPAALEAVLRDRQVQADHEQEETILAQLRQEFITQRRAGFLPHLYAFAGVNVFLLMVNLMTNSLSHRSEIWFIWPLLVWSLFLYFHAIFALPTRGANFDHSFAGWRERRTRKREKETKKQAEEAARTQKTTTRRAAEAELDE